MADNPSRPTERTWGRTAARWLPVAAAAGGLLVVSQLLWLWETWPVRQLLAVDALLGSAR